ncbi:UDP-N-acetylmuramoyl-L-alanyl-D-glutamate--2,6-diaminopimelate ligase [Microcella alkalica]|uniref:Mur ligase family protein n=1 Tax=Microcella alkalica TaxID=355930 RepID=UPI0015FC42EE
MSGRAPAVLRPEHPVPRPLAELLAVFPISVVRGDPADVNVSGVTLSTDDVRAGDLYVGVPGRHRHGAEFAAAAIGSGAAAVLTDAAGADLAGEVDVPLLLVEDPRAALGEVSAWVHRSDEQPPLLIGVTGTNGKTSTAYLLDAVLRQLGLVCGLSTTAERRLGELTVSSSLTTPEASETHALLARARELGVQAMTIEVSAQALTRHRVDGIVFDVAGFTNLSHDHLDDYADMEEYFQAKAALFSPTRARRGVVCTDTSWGERLAAESEIPVTTIGSLDGAADWRVEILEETQASTTFAVTGPNGIELRTGIPVIGRHMAMNAGLAIAMIVEAGVEVERLAHSLHERSIDAYLPGRLERVSGDEGPSVFVDFAHSPDAFVSTLAALRRVTPGRIIMMFGADGDRDTTKRADMGRVAAEGSDLLIITDFDSRTEDPAAIRRALLDGARTAVDGAEIIEVASPEEAIRLAVRRAAFGDSILWAGPGHQDYREVGGVKHPHSARDEARAALRDAGWPAR